MLLAACFAQISLGNSCLSGSPLMQRKQLRLKKSFQVVLGNSRSQAAEMVLPPGESEGGADNRHRGADQWLFVVSGTGQAIVNRRRHPLKANTLLLIEHGDTHTIKNTGRGDLVTINFYVPPGYTKDGEELPAGKK
jgi:mannose-6-phosphate isomerase-like protein (cupin superfamily)